MEKARLGFLSLISKTNTSLFILPLLPWCVDVGGVLLEGWGGEWRRAPVMGCLLWLAGLLAGWLGIRQMVQSVRRDGAHTLSGMFVVPRALLVCILSLEPSRKVDVRLPGTGNSNFHGARPVHLVITTIKWFRTCRLSIKTLSLEPFNL